MPRKKKPGARKCPKCGEESLRLWSTKSQSGKQRWTCLKYAGGHKQYCYSTVNPDAPYRDQRMEKKDADKNPQFKRKLGGIKRFVITAAQNATPAHAGFFTALKAYCEHNNAELVVIPIRYKNPTSKWTQSQENAEWWAPEVVPYLYNQRKKLNKNLTLLGDIKVQPTAVRPLSGLEAITHGESGIIGHTKLQMQSIATPQGKLPKLMTTTGACTVSNYSDTKAGAKGDFHHALAAVAVDIVGDKFFMYQINANSGGEFQHLDTYYSCTGGVLEGCKISALVLGDTHRAQMDPDVEQATFGRNGIVEALKPRYLVFHDLHDGLAVNHHERKNPFSQVQLRADNQHSAEKEVREDVKWLDKVSSTYPKSTLVLVPSNHDDFLTRYLTDVDWRQDPDNAEFYLESALAAVRSINSGEGMIDVFPYWVNRLADKKSRILPLKRDESFQVEGIEIGMHGDRGPNGARGSVMNLRRIGVKSVIGHSHSPAIEEGCYQTGTSSMLRMNYNTGPSSWQHSHCIIYPNGKRSLVTVVDGRWRW